MNALQQHLDSQQFSGLLVHRKGSIDSRVFQILNVAQFNSQLQLTLTRLMQCR